MEQMRSPSCASGLRALREYNETQGSSWKDYVYFGVVRGGPKWFWDIGFMAWGLGLCFLVRALWILFVLCCVRFADWGFVVERFALSGIRVSWFWLSTVGLETYLANRRTLNFLALYIWSFLKGLNFFGLVIGEESKISQYQKGEPFYS